MTVVFGLVTPLSTSLLLPMRLIVYNHGNRKLVITSATMDLPQPIVVWLQESVQYRGLIDRILPAIVANNATLPPDDEEPSYRHPEGSRMSLEEVFVL